MVGCTKSDPSTEQGPQEAYVLELPAGFPQPAIPEDNALTVSRVELGKRLFFDKKLSGDHSISCATCHEPERSFTETNPISIGVDGVMGFRNSTSLANVAYQQALFMEGGVPSLELQAVAPLTEVHEMNIDINVLLQRLEEDPTYVQQFRAAYDTPPSTHALVKALASFQRTLISGNSRYDQYIFQGQDAALTASELAGMELFFSDEVGCDNCHSGFLLTNQTFQNIGLYETYADEGRGRLTEDPTDIGKFKVPSLRNVAVTSPYMHDGSLATLEAVIDHFDAGGVGHENQSPDVQPLGLTEQQKADLVNFLEALTDHSFLENPNHQ